MTTTRRDQARRCDRCERVVLGVRLLIIGTGEGIDPLGDLCVRCRGEVAQAARNAARRPGAPTGG